MKRLIWFAVLLVAAGGLYFIWSHYVQPGDEVMIRKTLLSIPSLVSYHPAKGTLARMADLQKFEARLDPELIVEVEGPGGEEIRIEGRSQVMQMAIPLQAQFKSLTVHFLDVLVRVGTEPDHAEAALTMSVDVGSDKNYFIQELSFDLIKQRDQWIIRKVQTVETLK